MTLIFSGKSDLDRIGLSAAKGVRERISGKVQDCGEGMLLDLRRLQTLHAISNFFFTLNILQIVYDVRALRVADWCGIEYRYYCYNRWSGNNYLLGAKDFPSCNANN